MLTDTLECVCSLYNARETQHQVVENLYNLREVILERGGGPRVVVSTAAFHARVRGRFPGSAV